MKKRTKSSDPVFPPRAYWRGDGAEKRFVTEEEYRAAGGMSAIGGFGCDLDLYWQWASAIAARAAAEGEAQP
jgi:hypothetical protein